MNIFYHHEIFLSSREGVFVQNMHNYFNTVFHLGMFDTGPKENAFRANYLLKVLFCTINNVLE